MPEMRVCVQCGKLTPRESVVEHRCPECGARRLAKRKRRPRSREAEARQRATPRARFYRSAAWKRVRLVVLHRDGYRCHWCGREANEADHLIPFDERPDLALELTNLVAACRSCNGSRGARTKRAK
jgi:5-methylcytosine-specific restriction endonuclease McrA